MDARIALTAQERSNWVPAGNNLVVDLELSPANAPPGTRLAIGTAVIEITAALQTAAGSSSRGMSGMRACR